MATTKIVSFGYRNGEPDLTSAEGFGCRIVNVKAFRNPYLRVSLRPLSGLDLEVQHYIRDDPRFLSLMGDLYRVLEKGPPVLYLGCVGGRHRSVYLAERLGQEFGIPVVHRDLKVGGKE